MAAFQTSGFGVNIPATAPLPMLAKVGALRGFDPSTFAYDLVSPYLNGLKAGRDLVQPIDDAIKTFDPLTQAKRAFEQKNMDFETEQMPTKAALSKINLNNAQSEAEINALKQAYLKKAYSEIGGGNSSFKDYQITPTGEIQLTPEAQAKKEQTIAIGKKTPQEIERENLALEQQRLDVQNNKELNDAQKKEKIDALNVQSEKNKTLLNEYAKLNNPSTGESTISTSTQEVPKPVVTDPYASLGKPPAATLMQFDPASGSIKQVANPAYEIYKGRVKSLQDTEESGRKEALKAGMPDAMTAPISEVAKYIKGGGLEPILQAKAATALDAIKTIKPLVNWGSTGTVGNIRKRIPFTVNDASRLRAQLEVLKSQLSLSELLKMKASGASFGALSDKDLELLGNSVAALDPNNLDAESLTSSLDKIEESMHKIIDPIQAKTEPAVKLDVNSSVTAPSGVVIKRTK